ncbi:type II toxin-antitoxin system HicB family antitoxin [candidate division WOR-3 bacterium]|uniref:Type II toxin-antitoxin system HicB family antitoxin n=1 Tax=candidate division WOR-3 bacterium TaxID=2052148 RepID=A0A938BRM8_UNCW3|nr:type II toxin-antitoxin system HicB family antitoxin [candidate division WOR-3 bacterium]
MSSARRSTRARVATPGRRREFDVVIERDEDGYYVASVPALRGCHTQARSLDALMKRIQEAIALCLEVEEPVTSQFVGVQRVTVAV